jgi:hypothetical protein
MWKDQVRLRTFLSRDNFLRRNIYSKPEKIGLGWVNFQVLRRIQASLGHKEGVDPKAAADQRGHAIGVAIDTCIIVAIDTCIMTDLETKQQAVTASKKRCSLKEAAPDPSFRGRQGKMAYG